MDPGQANELVPLDVFGRALAADSAQNIDAEEESSGQSEEEGDGNGKVDPLVKGFGGQDLRSLIGLLVHVI